jgi:hypothetical protein
VIGWELGGFGFVAWTTARLFDLGPRPAGVLLGALAVLWLAGSWRILRMGVYVSGYGVRVRGVVRSRTLRWTDIESFALHHVVHRFGGFELTSGATVLIERQGGRTVRTSLWAEGIDFHAQPGLFRSVYDGLRERHRTALTAAG